MMIIMKYIAVTTPEGIYRYYMSKLEQVLETDIYL